MCILGSPTSQERPGVVHQGQTSSNWDDSFEYDAPHIIVRQKEANKLLIDQEEDVSDATRQTAITDIEKSSNPIGEHFPPEYVRWETLEHSIPFQNNEKISNHYSSSSNSTSSSSSSNSLQEKGEEMELELASDDVMSNQDVFKAYNEILSKDKETYPEKGNFSVLYHSIDTSTK